jgi:NTE family protein
MATVIEADGIFQGGGVRGLALAGALLTFAEHERLVVERWVNVAGTSAGAVIAAYLATDHGPDELERLLREIPYEKFQDWGPGGQIAGGAWNLATRHGLARGEFFRDWLDEQLAGATFASVRRADAGVDKGDDPYRLRLIAADITRHRMLVLPADLAAYRLPGTVSPIDPDTFRISDAVRMSMSIPFFYEPVTLETLDGTPCTIVDGSILSSFPVWLFDVDRELTRPTFGFHLTGGGMLNDSARRMLDGLGWPLRLAVDMFHTVTEAWDARFMSNSTVVRTCQIETPNTAATDFSLGALEQQRLVEAGREAARTFLDDFQIDGYVNTFGRRLAPALSGDGGPLTSAGRRVPAKQSDQGTAPWR